MFVTRKFLCLYKSRIYAVFLGLFFREEKPILTASHAPGNRGWLRGDSDLPGDEWGPHLVFEETISGRVSSLADLSQLRPLSSLSHLLCRCGIVCVVCGVNISLLGHDPLPNSCQGDSPLQKGSLEGSLGVSF